MGNIAEKWKAFTEWQQRPYQVAGKSPEQHRCRTCGEEFQGNYCPRCGQSAKIGRYSFKKAFLLFLDVWGLGNRGMFRTLRDLLLRPGFLIRDYISGMQMAYFPPFKLLFLLTALYLVVDSGVNLKDRNFMLTPTTEQSDEVEVEDDDMPEERTFAMVYIWNMYFICFIALKFLNAPSVLYNILYLSPIVPLK